MQKKKKILSEDQRQKAIERVRKIRLSRKTNGQCESCGDASSSTYCLSCDKRRTERRLCIMHSFDATDLQRYQMAKLCDWCGLPFSDKKRPHVDHDHRCCDSGRQAKHCWFCTRGFLHYNCNQRILWAHEFMEIECGFVSPQLAAYRAKFPVPRIMP